MRMAGGIGDGAGSRVAGTAGASAMLEGYAGLLLKRGGLFGRCTVGEEWL